MNVRWRRRRRRRRINIPARVPRCRGWRGGVTVRRRTSDQEVEGSIPGSGRNGVSTLGKLFTPTRLDADSLRYCMESLHRGTCLPLYQDVEDRIRGVCFHPPHRLYISFPSPFQFSSLSVSLSLSLSLSHPVIDVSGPTVPSRCRLV